MAHDWEHFPFLVSELRRHGARAWSARLCPSSAQEEEEEQGGQKRAGDHLFLTPASTGLVLWKVFHEF